MKAILEFNLPEEKSEHELHLNGPALFAALHNIKEKVFHKVDEGELPDRETRVYREIHNLILEELEAYEIQGLFS